MEDSNPNRSNKRERNDMATEKGPPTIEELARRLDALEKENGELRSKIEAIEKAREMRAGRSRFRTRYPQDPGAAPQVQDESITNEAISDVLGGFIDNFNEKAEKKESPVGYMISNMDIELKTQVIKDGNELVIMAVDPDAAPETVSTVRMSVRAVPRSGAHNPGGPPREGGRRPG